jgi:hypothetical protein
VHTRPPPAVVLATVLVAGMVVAVVVAEVVAVVVAVVVEVPEQSHALPGPHGHCPSGSIWQTAVHLESVAPYCSAPLAALQPAEGALVVAGAVVVCMLVDACAVVVVVVVVVVPATVVVPDPPLEGNTVISAQFQNCSPQPQYTLEPQPPGQEPEPAVHQASLVSPTQ